MPTSATGPGLLSLVIAAIGIAAVLAFSVSARTSEIGVRMSLGVHPGQVLATVLREGGTLVAIGLAIGVTGALVLARYIQGCCSPLGRTTRRRSRASRSRWRRAEWRRAGCRRRGRRASRRARRSGRPDSPFHPVARVLDDSN